MWSRGLHRQGDSGCRPPRRAPALTPPVCVDTAQDNISSPALSSVTGVTTIADNALVVLRSIPFTAAAQPCFPAALGSGHCESTTGFERNHSGDAAIGSAVGHRG